MRLAFLALALVATVALAQPRASRCWAACERNVTEPRARASACARCLTHPDDVAGWLAHTSLPLEQLLADPDWDVRWAALERAAKQRGHTPALELAAWYRSAPEADRSRACATALHAAGSARQPLARLLGREAALLEPCARLPTVLAVELYDEAATTRQQALRHLAVALERPAARLVLDVAPTRAAAFDPLLVDTLGELQGPAGQTAPAALLAAASPTDVSVMNRLLAVFAARHDAAKQKLGAATDVLARKAAMLELAALAPLSEAELLDGLTDAEQAVRLMALRGLARGEGTGLSEAAGRRLAGEKPATRAQRLAMLELMDATHEPACATIALSAWGHGSLEPDVRARALSTAAACRWEVAAAEVWRVLRSPALGDRVAGVGALASAPASEQLFEQLRHASGAPEAELRAAAIDSMAARRWRGGLGRVTALVTDEDARVRAAALRALLTLEAEGVESRLVSRLGADPAPEVRMLAAELLGRLGSPRAIGALREAARNDADPGVKLVVGQTLRRLGAGSLSP